MNDSSDDQHLRLRRNQSENAPSNFRRLKRLDSVPDKGRIRTDASSESEEEHRHKRRQGSRQKLQENNNPNIRKQPLSRECRSNRRSTVAKKQSYIQPSSEDSEEADDDDQSGTESAHDSTTKQDDESKISRILGRLYIEETGASSFLVLWKGQSYSKAQWLPYDDLCNIERGAVLVNNFIRREESGKLPKEYYLDPPQYFDPKFTVAERIVDVRTSPQTYLVKWCNLDYTFCTWESEVNPELLEQFQRLSSNTKPRKISVEAEDQRASEYVPVLESPVFRNQLKLHDYQVEGLNWLAFCWHQQRNSILADEMGLGKTIQAVSLIDYLVRKSLCSGPYLVVAPLSTLAHWHREIETWTDLNSVVYSGSSESRSLIRKYEFYQQNNSRAAAKFDVIVTSYEIILTDFSVLSSFNWSLLVVDEAHRLKNQESQLFQKLEAFSFDHAVLLTGTPIQNNIKELWTLLHFLEPSQYPDYSEFEERFGGLSDSSNVDDLRETIKPFILRRMKHDVATNIAPKQETIVQIELTQKQKIYYKAVFEKNVSVLKNASRSSLPSLMNIAMQLRKICNHPWTLQGVEDEETNCGTLPYDETMQLLINASGKMILLDKLLPRLRQDGHRVLIFSQFIKILDILEDYLQSKSWELERIDGSITGVARQQAIDRFSDPQSTSFVFLLCTKAGGLGINLTAADTVIIFDSDWNPQNDVQAQARCHRIGQTQAVKIYRLITRATYEEEMFHRSSMKLGVDQAVLHTMRSGGKSCGTGNGKNPLSKKEVESLLKHGAYEVFKSDDGKLNEFCQDSIDLILQRSQVIEYDDALGEQSSFSKASFIMAGDDKMNMDDPEFWSKLGIVETTSAVVLKKRSRRRRQSVKNKVSEGEDDEPVSEYEDQQNDDSESSDDDDMSLIEDEINSRKKRTQVRPREQVPPEPIEPESEWSMASARKLIWFLTSFGYGRFDLFRSQGFMKTTSAMRNLSCFLIAFSLSKDQVRNCRPAIILLTQKITDDLGQAYPEIKPSLSSAEVDSILKASSLLPSVLPESDIIALLLEFQRFARNVLRQIVIEHFLLKPDYERGLSAILSQSLVANQNPTDWWLSPKHDIQLLHGTYQWGLGSLSTVRKSAFFPELTVDESTTWPVAKFHARVKIIGTVLMKHFNREFVVPGRITFTAKQLAVADCLQPILNESIEGWNPADLLSLVNGVIETPVRFEDGYDWAKFRSRYSITKAESEVSALCQKIVDRAPFSTEGQSPASTKLLTSLSNRIALLRQTTTVASLPHLAQMILWRCPPAPRLPKWWNPKVHDEQLIKGVATQYFGYWRHATTNLPEVQQQNHWITLALGSGFPSDNVLETRLTKVTEILLRRHLLDAEPIQDLTVNNDQESPKALGEPVNVPRSEPTSDEPVTKSTPKKRLSQSFITSFFKAPRQS
uniref:Uncharacterized protein n=1 Tax=Spongospora subterranea TaxID=70186 RepID=A0A0H5QZV2_9EUKA|eukprot:CRZ07241.1 hypothetical protein [Spongospora subterranea]